MTREQQVAYEAVFGMAEPSTVRRTVKVLEARLEFLRDALDHPETDRQPMEAECRILDATVAAIKAEFAPGYFDPDYHPND